MNSAQFLELLLSLTATQDVVMSCPSTASPNASPLRKIPLMESANAAHSKQMVNPEVSSHGNSQGVLQIIWLEDDNERNVTNAPLTRSSWIDGRTLVVDNGYAGAIYGHSGCAMQAEVSYRVPTEYRLRHSLTTLSEVGGVNMMDRTRDKVYGVAFVRVFVLQCPPGCEDRGTRELVDPLHVCEPIAKAFIKFLLPFADVASSCNVTGIALRVTLDPELVGYSVGCCDWSDDRIVRGLPECCTMEGNLDDALVPVIHPTASRIVHGPLELELIFYLVSL